MSTEAQSRCESTVRYRRMPTRVAAGYHQAADRLCEMFRVLAGLWVLKLWRALGYSVPSCVGLRKRCFESVVALSIYVKLYSSSL